MAICNGCGGIVGRDCFNPSECEWIARDMERREAQRIAETAARDVAEAVAGSHDGISLRDYFAAKAMQGLLAAQIHGFTDQPANGPFAEMAYQMADAMMRVRAQKDRP